MSSTLLDPTTSPDAPGAELPRPTSQRWRPLRAGLQNVWQYDHTTRFVFHDGRLLLRGRNGVGKTKVVEVLLPFLLEGSMQPNRLDPFGSRSRRMHYNLLHEGNSDQQTAIAYVWLEFGRVDEDGTEQFATVGAGLKARRSSDAVESWFFTTSLRIDEALHPVDDTRTPLSRAALEEAIGEHGQVLTTAREYRAAVNRLLFGVPAPQYEAMVDALLRLRQPHLSERLEPAELDTVLSDSLPPLDEDRLREVAEGFDRLEAHRTELTDRRRSLAAVGDFLDLYADYASVVATARAREVTRADSQLRSAAEAARDVREARDAALAERDDLAASISEVTAALRAAEERLATLKQSDAYRAVQDLEQAEQHHAEAVRRTTEATQRRDASRRELETADVELDGVEAELAERAASVAGTQREARAAAGDADLVDEHAGVSGGLVDLDAIVVEDVAARLATAHGSLRSVAEDRDRAIASVRSATAEVAAAQREVDRAHSTREDADAAVRDAADAAEQADVAEVAARDAFADAVRDWAEAAEVLALDDAVVAMLVDADPGEAAGAARTATVDRRDELDAAVLAARGRVTALEEDRDATREERDGLAAATHEPPAAPAWRTAERAGRAGAPFYLLAEFTDELSPSEQASIEAALGALGLLDAWVLPDGTFLGQEQHDHAIVVGTPAPGRTLADVARPVATEGMPTDTVVDVLRRIAVRTEDELAAADGFWFPDNGTAFVSTGGRFAMGPLEGRTSGDDVRYLGAAARERARQQRLAELDQRLAELDDQLEVARAALAEAAARRDQFDQQLDAFPDAGPVVGARARAQAAAGQLSEARERLARAEEALARAQSARAEAAARRDATALEVGLAAHVDRLDELAAATRAWRERALAWLTAVDRWADQRQVRDRAATRREAIAERVADDDRAAERASADRDRLAERVATLSDMVGAQADDIRAQVRDVADQRTRHEEQRDRLEARREPVLERVGSTGAALEHATAAHEQTEQHRDEVSADFVALVEVGVLRVLEVDLDGAAHEWGVRATLEHARQVVAAGPELPDDPEAVREQLERAENRLSGGQQQLLRDAVDIRPMLRREHGVAIPEVRFGGRLQLLDAVADELRADVTEREQRLQAQEQDLLESFLTGELHEHLRTRIRDAAGLVDTMNERLADCATTAGHRVRLQWDVHEDAAPGTAEAIDLLLRGRSLITDDQRADLRSFLQERLTAAREGDAAASLQERIGNAFDYRRWHQFACEFRDRDGGTWRRLTRQSHGAGSGGEKAVMLHLPLFAAMAAHYEAAPAAPRLIVLDEVFAGIDRETRGQLMGLLVELDLDALLTSHDEWGFYAELDGLSTYHLVRDPAMPGVLAEWFLWDGSTRWEMGS